LKASPSKQGMANVQLDKDIIVIFTENKGRYGAIRITKELRGDATDEKKTKPIN